MRKKVSLVCLIAILMSLTACYDSIEIDDAVYTIVIGIEKGITNRIKVVIEYQTYMGGGGGSTSQQQGTGKGDSGKLNQVGGANVHAIEASSMLEAFNLFNTAISRKVSLTHTKMLVISEEFAREGVERYVAPIMRYRETRPTMQVVVVSEDVEDFIRENRSNIGASLPKSVELMFSQSNETGFFPWVTFHDFYEGMLSPYKESVALYAGLNDFKLRSLKDTTKSSEKPPLIVDKGILAGELPRSGVAKREFVGSAVFAGGKMVGTLNNYETRYMLMVTGRFRKGIMTIIDKRSPENVVPFDIRLGRTPKITAKIEDGKPIINVVMKLEADVGAIQSRIPYEDLKMIDELNISLKEHIEEGINKTIEKTQKEYKADIFGFGFAVASNFKTIQEFTDYNWLAKYPDAKVNVNVSVKIRRTGQMIKSAPIISNKKLGGNIK